MPTVFAVSGSLRKGSLNTALLKAAIELAPATMKIAIHSADLPLYNADLEPDHIPDAVEALRKALGEADGLLIATPEYNYNVSGATRNFVDWVSRPYGTASLTGKPTAILGATVGMGGTIRAQMALRQSFVLNGVPAMPQPEIYVAHAASKFDESGSLTDEPTREFLAKYLAAFEAWIGRFKAA